MEQLSAERVKDIRRRLRLKRRELAQLLGVSRFTVESWETGRRGCHGPAAKLLRMWEASL